MLQLGCAALRLDHLCKFSFAESAVMLDAVADGRPNHVRDTKPVGELGSSMNKDYGGAALWMLYVVPLACRPSPPQRGRSAGISDFAILQRCRISEV